MPDHLAVVAAARLESAAADGALRQAVLEAASAGIPIAHVAEAADVSRPTVYAWIAASSRPSPP